MLEELQNLISLERERVVVKSQKKQGSDLQRDLEKINVVLLTKCISKY
jgi:hypothetical protein